MVNIGFPCRFWEPKNINLLKSKSNETSLALKMGSGDPNDSIYGGSKWAFQERHMSYMH